MSCWMKPTWFLLHSTPLLSSTLVHNCCNLLTKEWSRDFECSPRNPAETKAKQHKAIIREAQVVGKRAVSLPPHPLNTDSYFLFLAVLWKWGRTWETPILLVENLTFNILFWWKVKISSFLRGFDFRLEEVKETWEINRMWDPWIDIGTEKGYWWKKWGNLNKTFSLVNIVVLMLLSWFGSLYCGYVRCYH